MVRWMCSEGVLLKLDETLLARAEFNLGVMATVIILYSSSGIVGSITVLNVLISLFSLILSV